MSVKLTRISSRGTLSIFSMYCKCKENSLLTHARPLFFNLLKNEHDAVLRITAALMYREFSFAGLDIIGFCRAEGTGTSMSPEFAMALHSVSIQETNERLLWAVTFLNEIEPCFATNRQRYVRLDAMPRRANLIEAACQYMSCVVSSATFVVLMEST